MLVTTVGLLWPDDAAAQRPRGGAPPTGTAVRRGAYAAPYYRPYYSYPRYYYPFYAGFYSPWYYPYYPGFSIGFGFGFGWYGSYGGYWGPYGYPYAPYAYPPYYGWYDNTGSARLAITPRNAQVYVDGRFVGLVDEFDGSFQRLNVEIGEHELQVYLDGYRTLTQKVLFTRGNTIRIEHVLQPLAPGDPPEPKPTPAPSSRAQYPAARERQEPPYRPQEPPYRADVDAEFGTLSLRVNPVDAEIVIDGESWDRPSGENRFSIDLTEGPHQVEVRKDGFRPYARTVEVRRGRTLTLNVSLSGQ